MRERIASISDLPGLAAKLLRTYSDFRVFAFYGEMGVGKTTFIKSICRQLGVSDETSSPTFSLINEYITAEDESIFHIDFYRIDRIEEAFDLGYEEYIYSGSYCFIEWPEKAESILPENTIRVSLKLGEGNDRMLEII